MSKAPRKLKPLKEKDIPVSMKHFGFFKQELTGALTTLTLEMRQGFAQINARFAEQDSKFAAIDTKFAAIDQKFSALDTKFAAIDEKFSFIDAKFAAVDARFTKIETQLERVETKITQVLVQSEEQNDRKKAVMDSYMTIYEMFIEHKNRLEKVETNVGLH